MDRGTTHETTLLHIVAIVSLSLSLSLACATFTSRSVAPTFPIKLKTRQIKFPPELFTLGILEEDFRWYWFLAEELEGGVYLYENCFDT